MGDRDRILLATLVACCAACGGGDKTYNLTGTATVSGTVGGRSLAAADAVSTIVSQGSSSDGGILIGNSANLCNQINAHQDFKNGTALTIVLGNLSGSSLTAPTVGTYTVYTQSAITGHQGSIGLAKFVTTDATCSPATTEAVSGTVTLTRAEDTGYGGTFDLMFGTDHLTGSFNTGTCTALANPQVSCPP